MLLPSQQFIGNWKLLIVCQCKDSLPQVFGLMCSTELELKGPFSGPQKSLSLYAGKYKMYHIHIFFLDKFMQSMNKELFEFVKREIILAFCRRGYVFKLMRQNEKMSMRPNLVNHRQDYSSVTTCWNAQECHLEVFCMYWYIWNIAIIPLL